LLETIARKRGGVRAGGRLDMNKAAEVLLHDYRAGTLGNLSLETPESMQQRVQAMAERKAAADNDGEEE